MKPNPPPPTRPCYLSSLRSTYWLHYRCTLYGNFPPVLIMPTPMLCYRVLFFFFFTKRTIVRYSIKYRCAIFYKKILSSLVPRSCGFFIENYLLKYQTMVMGSLEKQKKMFFRGESVRHVFPKSERLLTNKLLHYEKE